MLLCNKKFNVQIQPYLSKIKHVFLFLCSVVTGLPTCEWKLTLNDHSTIEETVALIQGALKEIDEEGVMEVEACEDFLHIMFNPLRQNIVYTLQTPNT